MPFGRSLAPAMVHRHPGHGEAVARISWCVDQHAIGVITGEVGAGKTVAIRAATADINCIQSDGQQVMEATGDYDMSVFASAGRLASWAGTAPGCNESAGKVKSAKTRHGNRYLKGALGTAALAASRTTGTYLSAKYRRIATRRGPMKALVALQHSILVAAWNMLTNGEFYRDPGADYFTRRIPAKTKARAIGLLEALGYRVSLQHLTDTA